MTGLGVFEMGLGEGLGLEATAMAELELCRVFFVDCGEGDGIKGSTFLDLVVEFQGFLEVNIFLGQSAFESEF